MKIKVYTTDASEPDCRRYDYCCMVDGKEYCLAACGLWLDNHLRLEIETRARKLFGDVEIEYPER